VSDRELRWFTVRSGAQRARRPCLLACVSVGVFGHQSTESV
jgi:hypothetical protein